MELVLQVLRVLRGAQGAGSMGFHGFVRLRFDWFVEPARP